MANAAHRSQPMNRKQRRAAASRATSSASAFPDAWRQAIAEQLSQGHPPDSIIQGLVNAGAQRAVAQSEVAAAQAHPYVKGLARVGAKLAKRDWLLDMYAAHWRMGVSEDLQIPRKTKAELSTEEFLNEHYAAHRPVVVTDAAADWPAMETWSLDYFETVAGDAQIEVQFGRSRDADYEYKREKYVRSMPFRELLGLLRSGESTNDYYVTANNSGRNRNALSVLWSDVRLMDQYLSADGYSDGFFWLGPKGTITPYHHDLTNNFLIQVMGRKRVRLVPSYETARMRNWMHCYSRWTGDDLPVGPGEGDRPTVLECVIGPGEGLFLPVGWWHWVEGLDVTAGMSFTNFKWYNAFYDSYKSYGEL